MKLKKKSEKAEVKEVIKSDVPHYDNLRDVIDYTRPLTLFYSGVEDEKVFDILYEMGIRDFLMSYEYLQRRHLNVSKFEELGIKFFIDSGAYTYRTDLKYENYTIEQWESQIEAYLKWAERHKSIIFAIANLDLEGVVDPEIVIEWNEKYFEPFMLKTGIPVCFIHHDDTARTWEQYCQRYPYIGFSGAFEDDIEKASYDHLKIAEKYKTVVHGMAMTKTALLVKNPYYTADSTTFLVGLQYGEINYFTGQKMTRLKKDKWKGQMLQTLVNLGFDEQKLLEEDNRTMIEVNVYAFIEAEKYIRERCKSRMYWLRPDSNKRSEKDLEDIKYPNVEWLDTVHLDSPEVSEYAKAFNISQELPDTDKFNLVCDLTAFMNWDNEEYKEFIEKYYNSSVIKNLHDTYINRIVPDDEARIEDLKKFFKECLMGENTTLLYLGTNFDRVVKEREEYETDEEYESEDVSDIELMDRLSKFLPANPETDRDKATDLDALDDEIFENVGITPIRDEKGHFLKGQKQVLKPKQMYSKKFPKLACDTCYAAQKCPKYKAGYACAYNKIFEKFDTRDMGDIIQAMQGIANFSLARLQRSMMFEVMDGGIPTANTSNLINQSMSVLNNLKSIYDNANTEVLRQTKILRSDGTQEMHTQVSNPQSGGILSKIFGDLTVRNEADKKEDTSNVVADIKPEEAKGAEK